MTVRQLVMLDEHACRQRLGSTHFGRVALSIGALPVVFPVHFALLDGDPVFRTDAGTKLAAASEGNVLCLEIDQVDPETHTGWSVLVTGPSEILEDPESLHRAAALPLRPWIGQGDAFVRIRSAMVSGRSVSPTAPGAALRPPDDPLA